MSNRKFFKFLFLTIILSCAPRKTQVPIDNAYPLLKKWLSKRPSNFNFSGSGRFRIENEFNFAGSFKIKNQSDTLTFAVFGPLGTLLLKGKRYGDTLIIRIRDEEVNINREELEAIDKFQNLLKKTGFSPVIKSPVIREGGKIVIRAEEKEINYEFHFKEGKLVELRVLEKKKVIFSDFRNLEDSLIPFKMVILSGKGKLTLQFKELNFY